MKRARSEDCPKRAAMFRLNIGGSLYDTTRDTLSKCQYFEPFLAGRLCHATDEDGRLFVDRSGPLFGHLLQYMRTNSLPSMSTTQNIKHELIHECEFFGMAHMACRVRGELSPYDMRKQDRDLQDEDSGEERKLIHVFNEAVPPKDPMDLQVPLLPKLCEKAAPQLVSSYASFRERFDKLTGGLLDYLRGTNGIVFAGGSVLAALTGTTVGDVDIFLCCNQDEALGITSRVFEAVQAIHKQRHGRGAHLLVTRGHCALTFFQVAPKFIVT